MLDNLSKYDIVLGSNSPRRRELMAGLDIPFTVSTISGIEETYPADMPVQQIPEYLSRLKAAAYPIEPHELLITADTVVVLDGELIGKPHDLADAARLLHRLSGKTHTVVSGVCVTTADRQVSFTATTDVTFAPLTDDEIDFYVNRYQPLDKAGAYGVQEWIGYIAVESIHGSFYNVMGLPVKRLYDLLKQF